jgi:formate hydrogenlyase subunit 3/multisubunit Na+/H+ antiporter MnhD subunit
MIQVFFFFLYPKNTRVLDVVPVYLVYTRLSSILLLIGVLYLGIENSFTIKFFNQMAHVHTASVRGNGRVICILIGLSMKSGIFPFSFYHIKRYQNLSLEVLFFFQSFLKIIFGCFFIKYYHLLLIYNSSITLGFLVRRISRSLLFSTFRAFSEKSLNLLILYSGFASFRVFLLPCITSFQYLNANRVIRLTPFVYGFGFLIFYCLGLYRLFFFCSKYFILDSINNIHEFSIISRSSDRVRLAFIRIIIFLSGLPPSPLFFFKLKLLIFFISQSQDFFLFSYFLIILARSSFYYIYLIRIRRVSSDDITSTPVQEKSLHLCPTFDIIFFSLSVILLGIFLWFLFDAQNFSVWFTRLIILFTMSRDTDPNFWIY